jgi:hypothetical protein
VEPLWGRLNEDVGENSAGQAACRIAAHAPGLNVV